MVDFTSVTAQARFHTVCLMFASVPHCVLSTAAQRAACSTADCSADRV